MQIKRATSAGYCFGVERAFNMVEEAVSKNPGSKVQTLGPLIHNRQAIERLESGGVRVIKNLNEADDGIIVIRTHGTTSEILENVGKKAIEVVDATCPFVVRVQEDAKDILKMGFKLIIIGEKNHPEVIGVLGHVKNNGLVIEEPEEVEDLPFLGKLGVVIQTTQDIHKVQEIIGKLMAKSREILIKNTICGATTSRQDAAKELSGEVDILLVVGGRHSGNTKRLFDICRKSDLPSYLIETPEEIDPSWFFPDCRVGITAGASTPEFILKGVEGRLSQISDEIENKRGLRV